MPIWYFESSLLKRMINEIEHTNLVTETIKMNALVNVKDCSSLVKQTGLTVRLGKMQSII